MKYLIRKYGFERHFDNENDFKEYLLKTEEGAIWMKKEDELVIFIDLAKRCGYEVFKSI